MAKCAIKGCKRGATTRVKVYEGNGTSKTKPVCNPCFVHFNSEKKATPVH